MEIRIKRVFLSACLRVHLQDITLHKLWFGLSPGKFTNHVHHVWILIFKYLPLFCHVAILPPADMDSSNISSTPGSVCRCKILLSHPDFGKPWHCNMDGEHVHFILLLALLKQLNCWLCTAAICRIWSVVTVPVLVYSSSAICARGSHGTAVPELWPTAWRPPSPAWLFFTSRFWSPKHTAGLSSRQLSHFPS